MSEITRDSILEFFNQNPERPWHEQDIARKLGIDDRSELRGLLGELTEDGRLIRTRRRTYGLPEEMNLILGRLQSTAGGNGFVIPDEGGEDFFIRSDRLGGAWDGDKVVARPDAGPSEGNRQTAEIVRVLERRHKLAVGTLEYSKGYAILRPDSSRIGTRMLLMPESVGDLEAGSRIVARIVWPEDSGETEVFGEVTEFLGDGDDAEIETRAVILKFGLKDEFEPDTLAESAAVPPTVSGEFLEGRQDVRDITTFTIDGADAKDFDDAISLERLKGKGQAGWLRVGVHIADVSYYVAEGTSLDREARERATSVYLPGKVLPMLPEELSNGICSLVEGQDRLALSALVDLDKDFNVKGVKFSETVIRSDARLTYDEVQEFADGGRMPIGRRKLERDLKVLLNLTQALRKQRFADGALDFDLPEARVDVTEDGELQVTPVTSNQARQLVEELMLLANRLVASELQQKDLPALFRVHEDPSEERLENLVRAVQRFGYELNADEVRPADLQRLLKEAQGKPEQQLVNMLVLRSLKQARYSAENLGHFGLGFENYLHFTSPIRRYPDLVVHRVMRALLQRRLSPTLKQSMRSTFPELAEHTSERERVAEDAERDLTRYFHARWAAGHIGETFMGSVAGVTNFGVFVALPNGVEGLMHVSNLEDDYYMFFEDSLMLMGKHSRRKFRFGDRVEVRIISVNATARQIDLMPADMALPEASDSDDPARKARGKGPKKPTAKPQPAAAAKDKPQPAAAKEQAAAKPAGGGKQKPKPSTDTREPRKPAAGQAAPQKQEKKPAKQAPKQPRKQQEKPPRQQQAAPEPKRQQQKPAEPKKQAPATRRRKRLVFG